MKMEQIADCTSVWEGITDSILLRIFSYLDISHLGRVVQTCKVWNRVGYDESLWRRHLFSQLNVSSCPLADGKASWREEVKRVTHHAPTVLSETLTGHTDKVVHVSFSHDGRLFSTTSKDATLKVWEVGYPTRQKYSKDFRTLLKWEFTQFSCFNESDTMVLVTGSRVPAILERRSYTAILSLLHGFAILRVLTMDPSQIYCAWLDDQTLLGESCVTNILTLDVTLQIDAFKIPSDISVSSEVPKVEKSGGWSLFTFSNERIRRINFLTVGIPSVIQQRQMCNKQEVVMGTSHDETGAVLLSFQISAAQSEQELVVGTNFDKSEAVPSCSDVSPEYLNLLQTENCSGCSCKSNDNCSTIVSDRFECASRADFFGGGNLDQPNTMSKRKWTEKCHRVMENGSKAQREKAHRHTGLVTECNLPISDHIINDADVDVSCSYLPCEADSCDKTQSHSRTEREHHSNTTKTDSPKHVSNEVVKTLIFTSGEFGAALHQIGFKKMSANTIFSVLAREVIPMDDDDDAVYSEQQSDQPDKLIDFFGHATGHCLSADHRYLFINCRPWRGNCDSMDTARNPTLSNNIELRVIDLLTMEDVGIRYKGHQGFSPANRLCSVFPDVSQDYVSSGSEDKKGYLWDRHYQCVLSMYPHNTGFVSAVAFNPTDQETLVTVSDDCCIKVWRSHHRMKSFSDI